MSSALQVQSQAGALAQGTPEMSREKLQLLKDTIAKGTSDLEFALFLETCKIRGANPFSKLLYPVKRWDSNEGRMVMAIQSSIDFFRAQGETHGQYAGQLGPQWCGEDGVWTDVWLKKENPRAARVGVLRHDFKEPMWAIALWDSYKQTKKDGSLGPFWARMGPSQLAKCAEALALRRAFPERLGGLYTGDEMEQAGPVQVDAEVVPPRTLQEAAAREPAKEAPKAVQARVVRGTPEQEAARTAVIAQQPPEGAPWEPAAGEPAKRSAPDPLGEGDLELLIPEEPKSDGTGNVVIFGVPVKDTIWNGFPGRWGHYEIESKSAKSVDGKAWDTLPAGSVGGGSEGYLRFMLRVARENLNQGKQLTTNAQRAVVCLWHMMDLRCKQVEADESRESFQAATSDVADSPMMDDTPF